MLLNAAYRSGVRTLDTAAAYGDSQQVIGRHLKEHPDQQWTIVTKISLDDDSIRTTESICLALGRDPDVVLSHTRVSSRSQAERFLGVKDSFPDIRLGLSIYGIDDAFEAFEFLTPQIVQLPLNLLDQRAKHNGLLRRLHDSGIEVHVRSVFMQGAFFLSDDEFASRFPSAVEARHKLRHLATDVGLSLPELSLLYAASQRTVAKIVVGAEHPSQLAPHFDTLSKQLAADVIAEIEQIDFHNREVIDPRLW